MTTRSHHHSAVPSGPVGGASTEQAELGGGGGPISEEHVTRPDQSLLGHAATVLLQAQPWEMQPPQRKAIPPRMVKSTSDFPHYRPASRQIPHLLTPLHPPRPLVLPSQDGKRQRCFPPFIGLFIHPLRPLFLPLGW